MDYTITRVSELTTHDGVEPKVWVDVEYKVGVDGPFTERFAKADFNPSNVRLKLQAFASDLKSLRT